VANGPNIFQMLLVLQQIKPVSQWASAVELGAVRAPPPWGSRKRGEAVTRKVLSVISDMEFLT